MGTSPDGHVKLTTRYIPAQLKCLFIIENAESCIEGLLALVRKFGTRQIHQPAGMVIVNESHQRPMQPLHNGCYCIKPLCSVETTYIIPIRAIQGAVHFLLLTPQPDGSQWYLSNMIELNVFNFVLHVDYSTGCLN